MVVVVKSGGPELAKRLEEEGYEWVKEEFGATEQSSIRLLTLRCSLLMMKMNMPSNKLFHQAGGKESYDN